MPKDKRGRPKKMGCPRGIKRSRAFRKKIAEVRTGTKHTKAVREKIGESVRLAWQRYKEAHPTAYKKKQKVIPKRMGKTKSK